MITYKGTRYPDGQISVQILGYQDYTLTKSILSYENLFEIRSVADVLKHQGYKFKRLTIPCLFGQRSDRRFSELSSFDLKLIAEVINKCEIQQVDILDPHSDVALALIDNSRKLKPDSYIKEALTDIQFNKINKNTPTVTLVSPDAGAYKKVFELATQLNLPLVAAVKHRDLQGNITLNFSGDVEGRNCLIVDDLLDGGYTFHLLAEQLKNKGAKTVFLYTTHAYFNKGVDFTTFIDGFYCTNSVKNITHEKVTQFKIKGL